MCRGGRGVGQRREGARMKRLYGLVVVAVAIAVDVDEGGAVQGTAADAANGQVGVDDAIAAIGGQHVLDRLQVELLRRLPGELVAAKVAVAGGLLVDGAVQRQITVQEKGI